MSKNGKDVYQNITYTFDDNGNITKRENRNFITDGEIKNSTQDYVYDELDRLVSSSGEYDYEKLFGISTDRINSYETAFGYDKVGNITSKLQINKGVSDDKTHALTETTYHYKYNYDGPQPHAVTGLEDQLTIGNMGFTISDDDFNQCKTGDWLYSYDLNGNMTKVGNKNDYFNRDFTRSLVWDEENRLKSVDDINLINNNVYEKKRTVFEYDPDGERVVKRSYNGSELGEETLYITPGYTLKNGTVEGTHIFAGNSRIASKVRLKDKESEKPGVFYYTPDHLGSSTVITDSKGDYYEHTEYFPYGEVWVNERSSQENYDMPYKYTGKEYDPETKLTYYGARYYDAKLSRWISVDPPLISGEYLPSGKVKDVLELPGMGGVFNPINLNSYQYAGLNPVKYTDPNGETLAQAWYAFRKIGLDSTEDGKGFHSVVIRFQINGGFRRANHNRGGQANAFRHSFINALVTSDRDASTASYVSAEYEKRNTTNNKGFDNLNGIDILNDGMSEENSDLACDSLNNEIGRTIGEKNRGASNKDLAKAILNEYHENGLYHTKREKDGFHVQKTKLSDKEYNRLLNNIEKVHDSGWINETKD